MSVGAGDRIYLRRTYELAERGRGSTAPNPCVGSVLVRDATTIGEGFHHVRGAAHAEIEALRAGRQIGADARGATLYVSLEPCLHQGATPSCAQAVIDAGIGRVVVGALDPNPEAAGGAERLRAAGIDVDVAGDAAARSLIEDFTVALTAVRPYVAVKLAASLDGYIASAPGSEWLTGSAARDFVRELRVAHDAVLVGAKTVRIDDPQLTVRPPRARRRPYRRVVACVSKPLLAQARVFAPVDGYERTIVLVPPANRERFSELDGVADIVPVGDEAATGLDVAAALVELKARGITSVLCEGGPMLAAALIEGGLVDRLYWLVAPRLLANPQAVPALTRTNLAGTALEFDRVEQLGADVLLSARIVATKGG
jgi:diaminohydroxyphosphoribosylaminopyrimidine deaminase/5-amino-6-(5-phosphoribosylamino)uracil reductase